MNTDIEEQSKCNKIVRGVGCVYGRYGVGGYVFVGCGFVGVYGCRGVCVCVGVILRWISRTADLY